MGWNITLTSKKSIPVEDVQKVVDELPAEYALRMDKQGWGWPCYGDISKPNGNHLSLGGSCSTSGDGAERFATVVANGLSKLGHEVETSKITY